MSDHNPNQTSEIDEAGAQKPRRDDGTPTRRSTAPAQAYAMRTIVPMPYDRAVERVREALGAEGFGVLTEIDVTATLKKKLDVDFRRYVILGACNPPLAHRALRSEPDIGVLLPCNVVVYEGDRDGESIVSVIDPEVSLGRVGNEALAPVAADVKARLARVVNALGKA
jgi:uncharacterized protein (DUF302 family)